MNTELEKLKESTLEDIRVTDDICKALKIGSTDYSYWNGCRCQANVTLNLINSLSKK